MTLHLVLLSTFCLRLKCNEKCTKCSFPFTNEEVLQLSRIRCPCHTNEVELEWQELPAFRKATTGSKRKLCAFCSTFSPRPYQEYKCVTWGETGVDVFINMYYGHLLSCSRISHSPVSSSGSTCLTFGSTCCNFTADSAKRNTTLTWTFEILSSANIVRNSDKFLLLFKVHTIQIVIRCSLYLY